MFIHHTNYCSWLLIRMGASYIAKNNQEWIRSSLSALHILTLSGANSSSRQPHVFENAIREQHWLLWSHEEVPHAGRWECRWFQGINTQKKLFLLVKLSEEYFMLGSQAKHQESKDDVPGQPEQKPKIRTSNYSHKVHKKQATNPSVLEVHTLMYEA